MELFNSARTSELSRSLYSLLTPTEKDSFWVASTEQFLEDYRDSLTTEQITYVNSVLDYIDPNIFDTTTSEYRTFIDTDGPAMFLDGIEKIGLQKVTELLTYDIPSSELSCNCSTKSDYCNGLTYCLKGRSNCTETSGCGTFWSYKCDGRCWVY